MNDARVRDGVIAVQLGWKWVIDNPETTLSKKEAFLVRPDWAKDSRYLPLVRLEEYPLSQDWWRHVPSWSTSPIVTEAERKKIAGLDPENIAILSKVVNDIYSTSHM